MFEIIINLDIVYSMDQNYKFSSIYPLPALLAPLPLIPFTTEELTGSTNENEAAKGAKKAPRNLLSCLFVPYFTVLVTPSINTPTPKYSNDFMILTISFISTVEINKVNLFPAQTAPFPLIFLLNLFIAFEFKLLTNLSKLFLPKVIATFVSTFLPKFDHQEPKDPPD